MRINTMKKFKRILQKITGVHRIHHIYESYGYKFPFINYGYFDRYGLRKIDNQYHNCTISGIY